MTHENNQNPDDLNWMEISREDAINDVRHSGQRLPFIAAAVSLLIIGGGAVFSSTVSDPAISSPSTGVPVGGSTMTPGGIPVIPNVAPGVGGYDDDDEDEDDDDDYEDDDYEDDDDHEDDDHDDDEDDD